MIYLAPIAPPAVITTLPHYDGHGGNAAFHMAVFGPPGSHNRVTIWPSSHNNPSIDDLNNITHADTTPTTQTFSPRYNPDTDYLEYDTQQCLALQQQQLEGTTHNVAAGECLLFPATRPHVFSKMSLLSLSVPTTLTSSHLTPMLSIAADGMHIGNNSHRMQLNTQVIIDVCDSKFNQWYNEPVTITRTPSKLIIDPENAIWFLFAAIGQQLESTSRLNPHLNDICHALHPIYTALIKREILVHQQYTQHTSSPLSPEPGANSMFVCGRCTNYIVNFVAKLESTQIMYICTRYLLQSLKESAHKKKKQYMYHGIYLHAHIDITILIQYADGKI